MTKDICSYEGCTNQVRNGGVCASHGSRMKTCRYEGCTNQVKSTTEPETPSLCLPVGMGGGQGTNDTTPEVGDANEVIAAPKSKVSRINQFTAGGGGDDASTPKTNAGAPFLTPPTDKTSQPSSQRYNTRSTSTSSKADETLTQNDDTTSDAIGGDEDQYVDSYARYNWSVLNQTDEDVQGMRRITVTLTQEDKMNMSGSVNFLKRDGGIQLPRPIVSLISPGSVLDNTLLQLGKKVCVYALYNLQI